MKNKKVALYLLFIFFLLSCSNKKNSAVELPKSDNEILNTLISGETFSIIDLTKVEIDTMIVKSKNTMGNGDGKTLPKARLGRVVGIAPINDSVFVADQQQNCIWVLDKDGNIVKKIGRSGKGPNEFSGITGIYKSKNTVYTAEYGNARIKTFDNNFNLKEIYNHVISGNNLTGNKSVAATDSLLFLPSQYGTQDNLIQLYKSYPPFKSITTILPKLIPHDMQPHAYNNYVMDVNSTGIIAVSYTGLPYIFIYDKETDLRHVIYLDFLKKAASKNPSVKPVKEEKAIPVDGIVIALSLTNDGQLYAFDGRNVYQFSGNYENTYTLDNAWHFTFSKSDEIGGSSVGINATTMAINDNEIYLGSIFQQNVYQFQLW